MKKLLRNFARNQTLKLTISTLAKKPAGPFLKM